MASQPRPYLVMTIADLEALTERMRADLNVLDAVRFERGHRSTRSHAHHSTPKARATRCTAPATDSSAT